MSSVVDSSATPRPCSELPTQSIEAPLIEVFGLWLEAHSRLVARLDRELAEGSGLQLQTFEVLIRLARTPGEALTAGELANALALSSGGATRLIDRLVAAGLVARGADPNDRRVVRIVLTEGGRAACLAALPLHLDGLERLLAGPLTEAELVTLGRVARSVRDRVDAVDPSPE